jgi:sodium transport system permease protein
VTGFRWRHAVVVARRDLLDVFRQRSVWALLLLIPAVNVCFLLVLPGVATEREQRQLARTAYTAAVEPDVDVGDALAGARVATVRAADAAELVARRRVDVGLRSNEDRTVEVLVLSGRARSRAAGAAVTAALERRAAELVRSDLAERGLSTAIVDPFATERVDLTATGQGRRLALAGSLPLLVLLPLSSVIGLSSQRISGSKDRRVFEPLLVLPMTRASVLAGKGLSGLGLGLITLPAVVLPLVLGRFVPVGRAGRTVEVALGTGAGIVATALVLLVVLVAIGLVLGAAARTSTELSTVLQVVTLPVFLLGLLLQLRSGIPASAGLLSIPVFGLLLLLREIGSGSAQAWQVVVALTSSGITVVVLLAAGARLLDRETSVLRPSS